MKKNNLSLIIAVLAIMHSCNNNNTIDYPYVFLDSKKENIDYPNFDEMTLMSCGNTLNEDTLKMYCIEQRKKLKDGVFRYIIFFDSDSTAAFPNNPFTALYIDKKHMLHIKAIYERNNINEYEKLIIYEPNMETGKSKIIELNN